MEDLPEKLVTFLEDKYELMFGVRERIKYITWYGDDDSFSADFGQHSLWIMIRSY